MIEKFLRLYYRTDRIGKATRGISIALFFWIVIVMLMQAGERIHASQDNPQTTDFYY